MTPKVQIIVGDALDKVRELPEASIHCCVTSPPSLKSSQAIELAQFHPYFIKSTKISIAISQIGYPNYFTATMGKISESGNFCAVAYSRSLKSAEAQQEHSLSIFDAKKRKQQFDNVLGQSVAGLPTKKRPSVSRIGPLFIVLATQFRKKLYRWL